MVTTFRTMSFLLYANKIVQHPPQTLVGVSSIHFIFGVTLALLWMSPLEGSPLPPGPMSPVCHHRETLPAVLASATAVAASNIRILIVINQENLLNHN